jgi:hypothetical protein
MDLDFKAFQLTRNNADSWDSLLALNGGRSAPWITEAPGTNHQFFICCLVLRSEPPTRVKIEREDIYVETTFGKEEWSAYYTQIAILVPIAVQSGIAMAQGIKRLSDTCPCQNMKGLGIALLAQSVQYFHIEYLFLSPIQPFKQYLERELNARRVHFGEAGYRSLCWAMNETENTAHDTDPADSWIDIRSTSIRIPTSGGKRRNRDAVLLTITPQSNARAVCLPRELLLNEGFYYKQREDIDRDYKAPPPLEDPLETFDFLWFIAGDGVMVVHGPSLAANILK